LARSYRANLAARVGGADITRSQDVFWGWRDGTRNNGNSIRIFQGNSATFTVNRAFELRS